MNLLRTVIILCVFMSTFALNGCASHPALVSVSPQKAEGQNIVFYDGTEMLASHGIISVGASTAPDLPIDSEYLEIALIFANPSKESIDIIVSNIIAYDENGHPLRVLSPEEQAQAVEKQYKWQRIGLAMQAAGAAMSNTKTANHSGTVNGAAYSGTTEYEVDNSQQIAKVNSEIGSLKSELASIKGGYIRNHTLFSEQVYGGSVWVALPNETHEAYSVVLNVNAAGEAHSFRFKLNPPKDD